MILAVSLFSALLHLLGLEGVESIALPLVVVMIAIYTIYEMLEERRLEVEHSVNGLMVAVGTMTYFLRLHLEGALVLGLYGLAEILEELAMERAESGMKKLVEYLPRRAKVVREEVIEVDPSQVEKGDLILVPAGERVPVDGIVVRGRGSLDQSIVTGEPLPITVEEGAYVYSGSLLLEGSIVVRTLKHGGESFVAKMLEMVERYKERKSRGERSVHIFSKYYLPGMLILALIAGLTLGIKAAIVLIAVACPSAFLVAAPATTLTSLAISARKGVLFKGSMPLEKASSIKVVALDKTGTLTLGRLRVRDVVTRDGVDGLTMIRLLASLELASQHPIAKAVVEHARSKGINLSVPGDVEEVPGYGIKGMVDGIRVSAGKGEFIGVEADEDTTGVIVHISLDDKYVGYVTLGDEPNPDALNVIRKLKDMGMLVAVLTGDRRESAEPVVKSLNVDMFYSELKPEDKVKLVDDFRVKYGPVSMVGDGINDAPALAASDLGVSVGNLEASMEAGDVALISGLRMLPWLFKASRVAMKKFWQNISIIFVSKFIAAVLGVLGIIPLWAAVAIGDNGGLLAVSLNLLLMVREIRAERSLDSVYRGSFLPTPFFKASSYINLPVATSSIANPRFIHMILSSFFSLPGFFPTITSSRLPSILSIGRIQPSLM
ncbi:MAG: cadmium-translocating P-type ATPase [Candidatus Korarchaeota archaeon]|nr:cadmium-translocating P-type ATPase [Candidatus Korarchaeota archaeon]